MEGERERETHTGPKEDEWPESLRWGEGERGRERLINGMERKISKIFVFKKKKKVKKRKKERERVKNHSIQASH